MKRVSMCLNVSKLVKHILNRLPMHLCVGRQCRTNCFSLEYPHSEFTDRVSLGDILMELS